MTQPKPPEEATPVDRYAGLRRAADAVRAAKSGAPASAAKPSAAAKPALRGPAAGATLRPTTAGLVVSAPRPMSEAGQGQAQRPTIPLVSHEYPAKPPAGRTTSFEAMRLGLKQLGRDGGAEGSVERPKALDAQALAGVNQEAMMQRAYLLIDAVCGYYMSNPTEVAAEKQRLRALPERELQAALISYQTASDHVMVMTDAGFAQRAAMATDKKLLQWYAQHGTNEEDVETVRAEHLLAHSSAPRGAKSRSQRP